MKTTAKSIFFVLTLILSLASPAFALDATQAVRTNVTPKSSIPTGTVATWAMDAAVPPGWLACNGQTVPASYPELRALMSSVPNYNNQQFLRGSTSGAGRAVADSTRSHMHTVPQHSHNVSGTAGAHSVNVASQSVTGTASGQTYLDTFSRVETWTESISSGGDGYAHITFFRPTNEFTNRAASPSSVNGRTSGGTYTTSGGTISGYTNMAGNNTDATGGAETAPQHVLVKYIIKAD